MIIGGKPADAASGETFEVIDPSTGKVLTEVPRGGVADVDAAVAAAREAFEDRRWSDLRPGKRTEVLFKLGELIKRNITELAQLESLDSGKPLSIASGEMWAAGEVFRYYSGWPTKVFGETNPTDGRHARLHAARADGRVRRDHPVELPADHGVVEGRAGPRVRQHGRAEARRADAADGDPSGGARASRPACPRASSTS